MKKNEYKHSLTLLFSLVLTVNVFSQENPSNDKLPELINLGEVRKNDEDFTTFEPLKETLKDVEIVMLGEQSHGEGTVYETKIKMIKYLHQEMGFEMLIFESGIYSCNKAWEQISNGQKISTALASSIFVLWSTTMEFKPLVEYIDKNKTSENPLVISGFDSQLTGVLSTNEFSNDLKAFISKKDKSIIESTEWRNLENSLQLIVNYDFKNYKKEQAIKDTAFISTLISATTSNDSLSQLWGQILKSTKCFISDSKLKTNFRDKQMAENLIWIKENNPGKKIICWGATSHFLYNSSEIKMIGFPYNIVDNYYGKQPMMGHYLKKRYGSKIFTIGFVAYQGEFGLFSNHKIKPAKENSLEYLIEKSGLENCLLDLNKYNSGVLISRPLGNKYMKNNISNVMDAVIFNRKMSRPYFDRNLYLKIYPENKWIKPEPEE